MMEKLSIEDLDGLKKVHDKMVELTLPNISADALKTVGKLEGEKFKKAILAIANNEDGMSHNRNYVGSVTCLLTGPVLSMLAGMGYVNLQYDALIKIGKECGREFRKKLSDAHGGNSEAKQWLQKKITEHGSTAPAENARPTQQQQSQPQSRPVASNARSSNVADINQNKQQPDFSRDNNPYPNASQQGPADGEREFVSMTFYGRSTALCFNATEKDGIHSMNIDAANQKPNQPEGSREMDWKDKIIFGVSPDELIEIAMVLLGITESCKFSGHGAMHDKGFEFKRQDGGFYAACSAKGKGMRGVPMKAAHAARLMCLVTRQLQKSYPHMTITELAMMFTRVGQPMQLKKVANG